MREEHIPILGITVFDNAGARVKGVGTSVTQPPSEVVGTVLRPVISERGWQAYEVFSPVLSSHGSVGTVGVRYDAFSLLERILSVSSVGETGETLLGIEQEGGLVLLHHNFQLSDGRPLLLGNLEEQYGYGAPLAQAVHGEEGLRRAEDYAGRKVFAAYRTLPSLGWGLVVKVERAEALRETVTLARFLMAVGLFLTLGAGIVALLLARRFTSPIVRLSSRMLKLGPGHWGFRRSVHTGDEIEVLDRVVKDLAERLQKVYSNLEGEVAQRTKELREQYAKDRAILQSIQHGVVVIDRVGTIIDVNNSAGKLLGHKVSTLIGTDVCKQIYFHQHRKPLEGRDCPVRKVLKNHRTFRADTHVHLNIMRTDKTLLPVRLIVPPLVEKNKLLGAVVVFQDTKEERRAVDIKTEFISLASHQLRTPLSTIRWYLEILSDEKNDNLTSVQRESVKEMQNASRRMSDLVETLLSASRLEGEKGSITPKKKRVNITAYITDIAQEFRSLAKDSKIACSVDIPKKIIMVTIDPILLHVAFQNIFSNAVKYSSEGDSVAISLLEKRNSVEISVQDTGIGIPKGEQHRMFERLFRAHNAAIVDTDGSGLGLYISKMVVETMGGSISFKSIEGEGTTFTVRLPLTKSKRRAKRPRRSE